MGIFLLKPLLLFLLFFPIYLKAEEEIIVKSSRLYKERIVGAQSYIIDRDFIKQNATNSIPEIIAKFPGAKIKDLYGIGFGAKQSIDLRGFADTASSNTLILLNGQRLTNIDLSLVDFTTIPRDSIDRIEIIMGNSSVLYGNNATAGSINIITDQSIKEDDQLNTNLSFGSFGKFESFISGIRKKKEFTIKGNQNLILTNGYRRNSGLSQKNGSIEFAYNKDFLKLYLDLKYNNQYQELPGDVGVNTGNFSSSNGFHIDPRSSDTPADFSQNNGYQFFYGASYKLNKSNEIILDGSYKYNKSEGKFLSSSTDTDIRISTYQLSPRILNSGSILNFMSDSIIGLDLNYAYYYQDKMTTGKTWYIKYKAQDINLASFFNSNIFLSDFDSISIGFRYQWNWLRAGDMTNPSAYQWTLADQTTSVFPDHQYAFHLGYEHIINQNNTLFTKLGKGFRYANIDERIGAGAASTSYNFNLSSQKSYDFEIGYKFSDKNLNIQTNFYYIRLNSEIKYDNASWVNRNLGKTHRFGIEKKINWQIHKNILFSNSFTIAQAKYRGGHRRNFDLAGVPAFRNSSDVNLKINKYFNLYGSIYYQSSQRMINDEENFQVVQPGYYLTNIGVKGSLGGFNYTMKLNNIFNKNYYSYAVASTNLYNVYNTYPLEEFNMQFALSKSFK